MDKCLNMADAYLCPVSFLELVHDMENSVHISVKAAAYISKVPPPLFYLVDDDTK